MIHMLHCADLHLSADEEFYGLAVLDEIITTAISHHCSWLLFAGDLFDSYADVERLEEQFRLRIAKLPPEIRTLVIAGNHERLRIGSKRLSALDLSPARFVADVPYELIREPDVELLAVPFASSHSDYPDWRLLEPRAPIRIALAHGSIAGMHFPGVDEEEEQGVMDPDLFARHRISLVALGHIHTARTERLDDVTFCYPGSARVWRRGESGPRCVNLVTLADGPEIRLLPLTSAGEYRRYELPLDLDGSLPKLETMTADWGSADWVELAVSGVIEDETSLARSEAEMQRRFAGVVRRLEVTREGVLTLEGIASQPAAKRFLDLWKAHEPPDPGRRRVWLKARELALLKMKELLEARR